MTDGSRPTSRRCDRAGAHRLPGRRGPRHRAVPGRTDGPAAAARGRARASARPRRPRRSPPLWTPRCCGCSATKGSPRPRRSTSGTIPASCSAIRLAESRGARCDEADLFGAGVPAAPAAAGRDRPPRAAPGRAAHRRGRPGRRRVRGVPVRAAGRGFGDHPRAGHPHAPPSRRSRSSPPTAPAICTTRCKRRCLYHWIRYPAADRVAEIIRRRVPGASSRWPARSPARSSGCAAWTCTSRPASPRRSAGPARCSALGVSTWTPTAAERTLGAVLKYDEDLAAARAPAWPRCSATPDRSSGRPGRPRRPVRRARCGPRGCRSGRSGGPVRRGGHAGRPAHGRGAVLVRAGHAGRRPGRDRDLRPRLRRRLRRHGRPGRRSAATPNATGTSADRAAPPAARRPGRAGRHRPGQAADRPGREIEPDPSRRSRAGRGGRTARPPRLRHPLRRTSSPGSSP